MPAGLSSHGRPTVAGSVALGAAAAALLVGAFAVGMSQARPGAAGTATAASSATGGQPASLTAATAASGAGRITVTGTGTVTGTPDQLVLSMGVQTNAASVSAALEQANRAVRAVTRTLARTGVRAADIQTSGLSIQPDYRNGSALPSGYGVSEFVQVTLRHLASAGSQISNAARAGGNATMIDGVSLNLGDTSSLLAAARTRAVADAKAKAAQYARALGRTLGPVLSLSESAPPQPLPVFPYAAANAAARASAVPVHPGTQQLSVSVTVVFGLG
jgi:uncharacterized protein YggE